MGYYDGNTVTALWNYAQHFALNDNNYTTQFGPSTPGAINLISGQTNGFDATLNVLGATSNLLHATHEAFSDAAHTPSNITEIGDGDPLLDVCSNPTIDQVTMARQEHRRSAQCQRHHLGLVHGRFRSDRHQSPTARPAALARPIRPRRAPGVHLGRLHPAPCVVPVLRIDAQSDPCASEFGGGDRSQPDSAHATRRIRPTINTTSTTSSRRSRPTICRR